MFDIIGDIHGCHLELTELITKLGYDTHYHHKDGRRLVFIGDITDRGPSSVACLKTVISLVNEANALYVPGNHCNKLFRFLKGNPVTVTHGLETTVAELESLSDQERHRITRAFSLLVSNAPPYLVLDNGQLVVAHAGIKEHMIGKLSKAIWSFCLYGDVDGLKHPDGRPIRKDWAKQYKGKALVVYGHTPVPSPRWVGNTVNIDQGCVFGGMLTALRYPERTTVSVNSTIDPDEIDDNPLLKINY